MYLYLYCVETILTKEIPSRARICNACLSNLKSFDEFNEAANKIRKQFRSIMKNNECERVDSDRNLDSSKSMKIEPDEMNEFIVEEMAIDIVKAEYDEIRQCVEAVKMPSSQEVENLRSMSLTTNTVANILETIRQQKLEELRAKEEPANLTIASVETLAHGETSRKRRLSDSDIEDEDNEEYNESNNYKDNEIKISESKFGKPKLFLRDFAYHLIYSRKKSLVWRCDEKLSGEKFPKFHLNYKNIS